VDSATRHQWLLEIRQRWEEGRGGKVLQRLLELAFQEAGYRIVEERLVEGIDFDVEQCEPPHCRYSLEVRTTANAQVPVKDEDLRQMTERAKDGYQVGLAALRIAPGAEWVFVERSWLLPPSLRISVGTCAAWKALGEQINQKFDAVLERLGATARDKGLDGLILHMGQARR
jgi:hypothetical protein